MKRPLPAKIPKFKNDEELAAFMEKYSAFDLVDAGFADIVPTPFFVRAHEEKRMLLKDKRIQVAFKDERALRKTFPSSISSARIFFVIDTDASGILLSLSNSSPSENFYVPYMNISGIKILEITKKRASSMRSMQKMAPGRGA